MKWFSYYEFIKSETATKLGIDNNPTSEKVKNNILQLIKVMDVIREEWTNYCKENELGTAAIIINSGYRCKELNKSINGSKTSAHLIGSAADFEALNGHNVELGEVTRNVLITNNIPFDQLLFEMNYSWIHLGLKNHNGEKRKQIFEIN